MGLWRHGRRRNLLLAALVLLGLGLLAGAALSASQSGKPSLISAGATRRVTGVRQAGTVTSPTVILRHPHARVIHSRHQRPRAWQMPDPVLLRVPAIGLSTSVIPLGLNSDGTLAVPSSFSQVGWFTDGPEPGERGAAVIAGHYDSKTGPGVFFRLRALRPGDDIAVTVQGGSVVHFVVTGTRQVAKTRFPTKLVYGHTAWPTLRLITCDGAFDSSTGHYVDNYIVFATVRTSTDPVSHTQPLLPDLRQEVPRGLITYKMGHRSLLGFTSAATNVGAGPLIIRGRRPSGSALMSAEQDVELANGGVQVIPNAGRLHYVVYPHHRHWHLEPFMRYELRRASDGRLVGRDSKTGFCLGDRYLGVLLPQSPRQEFYRSNCGRGERRLRHIAEGISVGYGDDYPALLEGQSIDITGLPTGRYYLVHRVNGAHTLVEASYGNNVAWLLFFLSWHHGQANVRVLDSCAPVTQPNRCASFRS